ncbi:MAG: hypothetical protein WCF92_00755 [bacterium]
MPNFLNLKKKDPSDIVYVEKIILKNRTLSFELFRMLTIIAVASGIVWGISNADNIVSNIKGNKEQTRTFSTFAKVLDISATSSTLSVQRILNDSLESTIYTVDATNAVVQTNDYQNLTLSDIQVGNKIIVKGILNGDSISAKKILVFPLTEEEKIKLATTTLDVATTTLDVATSTATTTEELASTTAGTTDSSTAPSILENVGNTISNVVDTIKDAAQNVIDTITQTTFDSQNSTGQAGSSTPIVPEVTPSPVVPEVVPPKEPEAPVVTEPIVPPTPEVIAPAPVVQTADTSTLQTFDSQSLGGQATQ